MQLCAVRSTGLAWEGGGGSCCHCLLEPCLPSPWHDFQAPQLMTCTYAYTYLPGMVYYIARLSSPLLPAACACVRAQKARKEEKQRFFKRNAKGQPLMRYRMEKLLAQIEHG